MFIFDCNGVLVDSESIVADVAAQELTHAGFAVSPEIVARFFTGRRPSDMLGDIEAATQRQLPSNFGTRLAAATLRRLHAELRATAHEAERRGFAAGGNVAHGRSLLGRDHRRTVQLSQGNG